jgi:nucleoid-associated protein YgaU
MSRTRVRRRRTSVALILAGVVLLGPVSRAWGGATAGDRTTSVAQPALDNATREYVVARGDTIWAIASRTHPERDPRPLVDAIEHLNGVRTSDIVPGQTLLIPISE